MKPMNYNEKQNCLAWRFSTISAWNKRPSLRYLLERFAECWHVLGVSVRQPFDDFQNSEPWVDESRTKLNVFPISYHHEQLQMYS